MDEVAYKMICPRCGHWHPSSNMVPMIYREVVQEQHICKGCYEVGKTAPNWLLQEDNVRYLEDIEIPYRKDAVKHAEQMLALALGRLNKLKNKGE
jgi:hypothetical protein